MSLRDNCVAFPLPIGQHTRHRSNEAVRGCPVSGATRCTNLNPAEVQKPMLYFLVLRSLVPHLRPHSDFVETLPLL